MQLQLMKTASGVVPFQRWLPHLNLEPRPELGQNPKGLWIEPQQLLDLINAWSVAVWAISVTCFFNPDLKLERNGPGAPWIYPNEVVLLTVIVMRIWRKGYESFTGWLARNPELAKSLGYTERDRSGRLRTISSAQLSRRTRALGFLPFFLFFVALVWQLIRVGAIKGKDLVIDSSKLQAWYHQDKDARWSYPTRWRGSTFGYKIHTVICRWFTLPVMFWVTPANRNDCIVAIPLLAAAVALYGFKVVIVRADAAYFTWKILGFIREVLGASAVIDYNLRGKGKKFLATLSFLEQWSWALGPRSDIERHFAWAKRYFGLKYFQVAGLLNVMCYCCCTYIAMLAVALVAVRCQRPELAGSRTNVLAWV